MYIPIEILGIILAYTTEHDLTVCARVSKSFHTAAVRLLYRHVHFDFTDRIVQGREAVMTPIAHHTPSRISQPRPFLRTLKDKPSYCSMIKSIALDLHRLGELSHSDVIDWATDVLKLLAARPAAEIPFVHLSCPIDEYRPNMAKGAPISSVKLSASLGLDDPLEHFNFLRSTMAMQSVQHITVRGLCWPVYAPAEQSMVDLVLGQSAAFSEVKTMSFTESGLPNSGLEKILTWPRSLQAFAYEIDLKRKARFTHPYVPGTFIRALRQHANTLEQVNIEIAGRFFPPSSVDLVTTFKDLPNLKRLSVPLRLLSHVRPHSRHIFSKADMEPPLHTNLPASIESLRIELPTYTYATADYTTPVDDVRDLDIFTSCSRDTAFRNWLTEFAENATEYCPRLRRVVVWWKAYVREGQELTFQKKSLPMREKFSKRGIRFTIGPSVTPPSFGSGTVDFVPLPPASVKERFGVDPNLSPDEIL